MNERPTELSEAQWSAYLRDNGQFAAGAYSFDKLYFEEEGRYPSESPLYGSTPRGDDPRRQAILNLVERGATEGERDAARAALERIDQDAADEEDYMDALAHGAA